MRFRRNSAAADSDEPGRDADEPEAEDATHPEPEAEDATHREDDENDEVDGDANDADDADEPAPRGMFGWLKPRKKKIDYGEDFTVKVAALPDLEQFPEDGHVHPEIVRSWMALQQFGEAMLLVSWKDREPVGYLLVSWTGDWDDDVRHVYPNVPALCNLWADEKYVDEDIERKLVEAAVTVCEKQGHERLIATVESDNTKVRGELAELGFTPTDLTTSESFVFRDSTGRRRRGIHQNVVLLKDL